MACTYIIGLLIVDIIYISVAALYNRADYGNPKMQKKKNTKYIVYI